MFYSSRTFTTILLVVCLMFSFTATSYRTDLFTTLSLKLTRKYSCNKYKSICTFHHFWHFERCTTIQSKNVTGRCIRCFSAHCRGTSGGEFLHTAPCLVPPPPPTPPTDDVMGDDGVSGIATQQPSRQEISHIFSRQNKHVSNRLTLLLLYCSCQENDGSHILGECLKWG